MTKVSLFLVILFATLLITNCGRNGDSGSHSDPARTINVQKGDEFVISLESNSTSGYSWEEAADNSMVSLMRIDYGKDEADEGMVGVGGREITI